MTRRDAYPPEYDDEHPEVTICHALDREAEYVDVVCLGRWPSGRGETWAARLLATDVIGVTPGDIETVEGLGWSLVGFKGASDGRPYVLFKREVRY